MQPATRELFSYRKHWASRFGTAPFLPMSREEMDALGWDSCDIIVVTGDAYVDHPSFGMAIIGRVLEAQGFRVGIIAQPDWRSAEDFARLGKPNLFFGITAGNMDSMVNRYTSDRRIRSDDAYTPAGEGGKRPDRSVIVYSQRVAKLSAMSPLCRRYRGEPAAHRALSTTGRRRCGARSCWTRRRTCSCMATANDRSSRSRIGWPRATPIDQIDRPARHGVRAAGDAGRVDGNRFDHNR